MNEYQSKMPTTYRSIMLLVFFFLLVDVVIAGLLIFKVQLPDFNNPNTDNNSLTNLVTDNAVKVTKIVTDNTIKTDNTAN